MENSKRVVVVIHGGAGVIMNLDPQKESAFRAVLEASLRAGHDAIVRDQRDAIHGVIEAVRVMEDSLLFNAGRGSVYTHAVTQEMDASLQRGEDKAAGAVCGVTSIANPIDACRLVMEQSEHVMLSGKGAEEFARAHGARMEPPEYFASEARLQQLEYLKATEGADSSVTQLDHNIRVQREIESERAVADAAILQEKKYGTVGACALDHKNNLAAGTSTGGMTNKRWGRVGDSPIIGAGTYASNATCAVSCTGHGEKFIRSVVAYDVAAMMEYAGLSVQEASARVVDKLEPGAGGLVALDRNGVAAMVFNTPGMYRGTITQDGHIEIGIYR